jgi:hypothetical protein
VIDKLAREWPLAAILAAQTVLTLPWLARTAPFTDEALYLDAGHQIWAHWLRHAPLPDYASWFSGAPVLYPPIGAVADSVGGLPAARAVSLLFMLGATGAVYFTARQLFGRVADFFSAVLFAVTGLVIHYGAFATYDAPAVFFLALAMWAAARIPEGRSRWLAICAVALVTSNAFKYATLAWDPVVIGFVLFHNWDRGVLNAITRVVSLTSTVAILEGGLLLLGGPGYIKGVSVTTIFRTIQSGASSSPSAVLWRALALTGIVVVTAAIGLLLSIRWNPVRLTLILALFLAAGLIAAVDQARIHELSSLDKNLGFGLIFPAVAAGYTLRAAFDHMSIRFASGQVFCGAAGAGLTLLALIAGRQQHVQFRGPSVLMASQVVAAVRHDYEANTFIVAPGAGRMEKYYLPWIPAQRWMGVFAPDAETQAMFRQRICTGQASVVLMQMVNGKYDRPFDYKLYSLLDHSGRYKLSQRAGRGPYTMQVWKLSSTLGSTGCS